MIASIPSLDELVRDPSRATGLSIATLAALQAKCAAAQAAIAAGLSSAPAGATEQTATTTSDRLIGVKEAAARLDIHPDTLYRGANDLPFTVRLGPGQLRFSSNGIDSYIRQRTNRKRLKD